MSATYLEHEEAAGSERVDDTWPCACSTNCEREDERMELNDQEGRGSPQASQLEILVTLQVKPQHDSLLELPRHSPHVALL